MGGANRGLAVRFCGPLGRYLCHKYAQNRFAENGQGVTDTSDGQPEQHVGFSKCNLGEYLFHSWAAPSSAEGIIQVLLVPGAYAKKTLHMRIPELRVNKISFIYGATDWMDSKHAQVVLNRIREAGCRQVRFQANALVPYIVENSGHQICIDNPEGFAKAICEVVKKPHLTMAAVPPLSSS